MGAWKVIRILLRTLVATGFLLLPGPALAAEEVSVKELIEQAADLSGEAVTVEGELVGDYGFRDDGWMWTQLNGDVYVSEPIREGGSPLGANNGIGIRMPIALAEVSSLRAGTGVVAPWSSPPARGSTTIRSDRESPSSKSSLWSLSSPDANSARKQIGGSSWRGLYSSALRLPSGSLPLDSERALGDPAWRLKPPSRAG
jgi:hypothetical protein